MSNAFLVQMVDGSEVEWSPLSHRQAICLNDLIAEHADFGVVKSFGWYKLDTSPQKMSSKHFGYITSAIQTGEFNCIHTHCNGSFATEASGGRILNQDGSLTISSTAAGLKLTKT